MGWCASTVLVQGSLEAVLCSIMHTDMRNYDDACMCCMAGTRGWAQYRRRPFI